MPLLGKQWYVIDGGASGDAPGGIISEAFGPSEHLREAEFRAAIFAADAVRSGKAALIDVEGHARALDVERRPVDVSV
jgi:hypothetical protein